MATTARRLTLIETVVLEQRKTKWIAHTKKCNQIQIPKTNIDEKEFLIAAESLISRYPWLDHRHEEYVSAEWEVLKQQGLNWDEIQQHIDPLVWSVEQRAKLEEELTKIKVFLEEDDLTNDERSVCQFFYDASAYALAIAS